MTSAMLVASGGPMTAGPPDVAMVAVFVVVFVGLFAAALRRAWRGEDGGGGGWSFFVDFGGDGGDGGGGDGGGGD